MLTPRGRGGYEQHSESDVPRRTVSALPTLWLEPSAAERRPAVAGAWPLAGWVGVVAAVLMAVGHALGGPTSALVAALELATGAAALAGARLLRPARALPWHLAGAALLVSGASWTPGVVPGVAAADAQLLARVLSAVGLGLGVAAAVAVVVIRARGRPVEPVLSVAATILAAAMLLAEVLRPMLTRPAAALPVELAALATAMGAVALHRWQPGRARPVALLLIGAATAWLAHTLLTMAGAGLGGPLAAVSAGLLPVSLGLLAAACLHPAAPALVESPEATAPARAEPSTSTWHIAALGSALLVLPLVSLSLTLREPVATGWAVTMGLGMVTLIGLVLARLLGLLRSLGTSIALRHAEARSDVATALPNARALLEDLEHRVARGDARRQPALVVVALTGVGETESIHGFEASAELLRTLADRIREVLPARAQIAALSRQDLAVVLDEADESLVPFGWRLCRLASRPVPFSGGVVSCGAVVGTAVHETGEPPEGLLRRAELASRWARRDGANRVQRYDLAMASRLAYEVSIRSRVRQAISHDLLQLWCQPQLELATGRLAGVECLARWRDARHGYVSPAEFVPAARDAGVAAELDVRMVNAAVRQAAQWRHSGVVVPRVAVNVEPTTLSESGFVDEVASALDRNGLPPASLEIELTEAVAVHDHHGASEVLGALRALGVGLAVDDFGTGYSSLADLHRLPLDVLKLDRELIGVLEDEPVLVTAAIAMAERLGLRLIAEGVETSGQLTRLQRLGCELGQGFLLARPMPADALSAWRRSQVPWRIGPWRDVDGVPGLDDAVPGLDDGVPAPQAEAPASNPGAPASPASNGAVAAANGDPALAPGRDGADPA